MLSTVLPANQQKFDAFMAGLGFDASDGSDTPDTAAGLDNLAAANVLAARVGDGSNVENGFADTTGYVAINDPEPGSPGAPGAADFDPNQWQPLRVPTGALVDANGVPIFDNYALSSFDDQVALTPQWGAVDSFALRSGDQFRPDAPPQLGDFGVYVDGAGNVTTGDQAYRDQVTEVLTVSAGLTTEQKVIAKFWADGPRTLSPPVTGTRLRRISPGAKATGQTRTPSCSSPSTQRSSMPGSQRGMRSTPTITSGPNRQSATCSSTSRSRHGAARTRAHSRLRARSGGPIRT